jgi:hypothetical protein
MPPADSLRFLNEWFSIFDNLVQRHGLEKIKTSGEAASPCRALIMQ